MFLECPAGKGWRSRQPGTQTRPEHPGTAVEWDGAVYEVFGVDALEGTSVRYRLIPWDHRHAIRRIERYDSATEGARLAARAHLETGVSRRWLSIVFSPLLGHLPGAVQKNMEHDFGAPANAMTIVSALVPLVVGVVGLLSWLAGSVGGESFLPFPLDSPIVAAYLIVESGVRTFSAVVQHEPMGSLVGHAVYAALAPGRSGEATRVPRAAVVGPPGLDRKIQDRYTMLEPLLALLSEAEQKALERHFAFDPLRWGRLSAGLLLLVAGANAATSIVNFLAKTGGFADLSWLLIGGFFVWEQIGRRRRIKEGKPAGSVLGFFVRPLARPLLDAARS